MVINDSEWRFFRSAVGMNGTYNDLYARYLRQLGLTGTLQDMIPRYKKNRSILEANIGILSSDDGSYIYDDNDEPVETY